MADSAAIGIFDSGIGGTSIWREIHNLLPNEKTIYLADSKNAPYGEKSKEEIIHLSCKNTEFLLDQNSKIIVVFSFFIPLSELVDMNQAITRPIIQTQRTRGIGRGCKKPVFGL